MTTTTLLAFCVLALSGYSKCDSSTEKIVSDGANCFTLNMYKELAKKNENLVCSPFSLDVLLSMLYVGSGGKTAQEMSSALGYKNISVENVEDAFQSQLSKLTSSNDNTLQIANSIWLQKDFTIEDSFKDVVENKFYSQEKVLDFGGNPHGATESINKWGNDKTNGLIPKLLDKDLDTSTVMFLENAIYFKGQWASKFEKANTKPAPFKSDDPNKSPNNVQMMQQQRKFTYHFDTALNAQVLEMNYKGDDMSMVVMLPTTGSNIDNLEKSLTCQTFTSGIESRSSSIVDVTMPKFDIASSFDLEEPIQNIGINDIFSPGANLSGIAPHIYVSKAVQKAVIKVYEEGSEAAALTGIGISRTASVAREPEIVTFRADHPFLYLIRDKRTGLILFMGRVKDPKSS